MSKKSSLLYPENVNIDKKLNVLNYLLMLERPRNSGNFRSVDLEHSHFRWELLLTLCELWINISSCCVHSASFYGFPGKHNNSIVKCYLNHAHLYSTVLCKISYKHSFFLTLYCMYCILVFNNAKWQVAVPFGWLKEYRNYWKLCLWTL